MKFMRSIRIAVFLLPLSLVGAQGLILAQTSASYDASEFVINQGGHPEAGMVLGSTSYRMSLDSVGDGLAAPLLGSSSYLMAAGFVPAYPPPGEVQHLRFLADKRTALWDAERSIGDYNVYRGAIGQLPGTYGACRLSDLLTESALLPEPPPAPAGGGYFYLVTARNRLGEEGTKGFDSAGAERINPNPCP